MIDNFKEFIAKHKYVVYIYIGWFILHIILFLSGGMINGRSDRGFFPFDGFDLDDYGILELFVYVIALPVLAYFIIAFASASRVFRTVLKWVGIVLASIAGLFLVFYLVSLLFGGDYGKTGETIGKFLGWMLAYGVAVGIQNGLMDWLSNSMVYARFGASNRRSLKIIYLAVLLPIIKTHPYYLATLEGLSHIIDGQSNRN